MLTMCGQYVLLWSGVECRRPRQTNSTNLSLHGHRSLQEIHLSARKHYR